MKLHSLLLSAASAALMLASCQDDEINKIGGSITQGEASITIDSTLYDLRAVAVPNDDYDSRTGNLMVGSIAVPEYGSLHTSFVSRMMCLQSLPLADTIPSERVDSCRLRLVISRDLTTGDSLLPQQLTVYRLNKQLPDDISNSFDPEGYYDASAPLGRKTFTASSIGNKIMLDNSTNSTAYLAMKVPVPAQLGRDLFDKYRHEPELFAWPKTFAQYFPGLYVDSSFGNGCVANVIEMKLWAYFWHPDQKKVTTETDTTMVDYHKVDSVALLSVSPEVLSSNRIDYRVSETLRRRIADGQIVITTPGGYRANFTFPAQAIIDEYNRQQHNLSIVSALDMTVPASAIENDFGLGPAPYMLMVKTKELHSFFRENKIPDNKTSFQSAYDAVNGCYRFSALRAYILDLIEKGTVTPDDVDFTFVPVLVTGETVGNNYYGSGGTYYITKCVPYTLMPTMTLLDTKNARVVFTFSSQLIE